MNTKDYMKDYYQRNKSYFQLRNKKYRLANPEMGRKHRLQRNFGLTVDEYNAMFEKQNGCCAICGKHQDTFKKRLAVDHNHSTGQIRGLCCSDCNLGLGKFKDSKELLLNALTYLKSFESPFQNN